MSRLCLGTMTFGSQLKEAAAHRVCDAAVEQGIDFFDTANVYNAGESERIVGSWLQGRRKSIVLATKVRGKMGDAADDSGLSRAAIVKQAEESLRRLKTDYIDVYYMHLPDHSVPLEESLEAIEQLVRQGKVRYPACSNYAAWQMVRMQWIANMRQYTPVHVAQPMYNLLARGIEQELLPMAKQYKVSTFVYNPLAGGLLTGKHRPSEAVEGSRFDTNKMYRDRYWNDDQFRAVESLRGAAETAGRTLISTALNWILHHTDATGIILGVSKLEHLKANCSAAEEGPLPAELVAACDEVWSQLRGVTPSYVR